MTSVCLFDLQPITVMGHDLILITHPAIDQPNDDQVIWRKYTAVSNTLIFFICLIFDREYATGYI